MQALLGHLTCGICQGIYDNPKRMPSLQCPHSFCGRCIDGLPKYLNNMTVCPLCHQHMIMPIQGSTALTSDTALENLIENILCLECNNFDVNAAKCQNCSGVTCAKCIQKHSPQKCRITNEIRTIEDRIPTHHEREDIYEKIHEYDRFHDQIIQKSLEFQEEYDKLLDNLEKKRLLVQTLMSDSQNMINDKTNRLKTLLVLQDLCKTVGDYIQDDQEDASLHNIDVQLQQVNQTLDNLAEELEVNLDEDVMSFDEQIETMRRSNRQMESELIEKSTQTEITTKNTETQSEISSNDAEVNATVTVTDAETQIPEDYSNLKLEKEIDVTEYVQNLTNIYDVSVCPITNNVYVTGKMSPACVTLIVYDANFDYLRSVNLGVITDFVNVYVSVNDKGELLLTWTGDTKITIVSEQGWVLRKIPTGVSDCTAVVSDPQNRLYIGHDDHNCVSVLDERGLLQRRIGQGSLKYPRFLHFDDWKLYVSDYDARAVFIFTPLGDLINRIDQAEDLPIVPSGLSVDEGKQIVVADERNGCIHIFRTDGTKIKSLKYEDGGLYNSRGLTVSRGRILLIDRQKKLLNVLKNTEYSDTFINEMPG